MRFYDPDRDFDNHGCSSYSKSINACGVWGGGQGLRFKSPGRNFVHIYT